MECRDELVCVEMEDEDRSVCQEENPNGKFSFVGTRTGVLLIYWSYCTGPSQQVLNLDFPWLSAALYMDTGTYHESVWPSCICTSAAGTNVNTEPSRRVICTRHLQ